MTNVTIKYKKKACFFSFISWIICFGTAVTLIIVAFNSAVNREVNEGIITLTERAKTIITTVIVSLMPMVILSVIVKDKIRPLCWMINIILSNIMVGSWLMYVVFAVWFIDEYIIRRIAKSMTNRYVINKEIDKRGTSGTV